MVAASRKETCKCEDEHLMSSLPAVTGHLHGGMLVDDLRGLGAGCTTGMYVCPRLLKVRMRYGK